MEARAEARAVVRQLSKLSSRRDYERLRALFLIVQYLGADYRIRFAEENFATLLYDCLKCMKEGLPEEIVLATRALSLLSMTLGSGDQADELYMEALPVIRQSLSSRDDPILISAINLLAVCAFVSEDFFVKEAAMKKLWGLICSINGAHVLSAAIAAWSFVLGSTSPYLPDWTTQYCHELVITSGKITHKLVMCKCFVFCFNSYRPTLLNLMGNADEPVHAAADDAFDVLQEKGSPRGSIWYFEDGEVLMIGKYGWKYSSIDKLVQVEFVLNFLGSGFEKHMLGNKYLQYAFNFTPEDQEDDGAYYAEREEAVVWVCMPMPKRKETPKEEPRKRAVMNKARTRLLKKKGVIKRNDLLQDCGGRGECDYCCWGG